MTLTKKWNYLCSIWILVMSVENIQKKELKIWKKKESQLHRIFKLKLKVLKTLWKNLMNMAILLFLNIYLKSKQWEKLLPTSFKKFQQFLFGRKNSVWFLIRKTRNWTNLKTQSIPASGTLTRFTINNTQLNMKGFWKAKRLMTKSNINSHLMLTLRCQPDSEWIRNRIDILII